MICGSYLMHLVSNLHFSYYKCYGDVANLLLRVKKQMLLYSVYAQYTLV